jgi:hypothetical protein
MAPAAHFRDQAPACPQTAAVARMRRFAARPCLARVLALLVAGAVPFGASADPTAGANT